ncbi:hypothetical protein PTT_01006 [Pyrenophora teres f. teres 0-1]|uniref:Uncharacterized protein n=1 Tax=Pyrenophora teres f. teres (strain 0-1) TaxID=861557 RepID=E3RCU1_PYRTT|nr:hypothetical protein PTT_01006 [Pyrenophora teres f. teres 0-1]
MRWICLSASMLLLLLLSVGQTVMVSGRRDSSDAAVCRLWGRRSGAGELSFPKTEEIIGKLLSETSLRSGDELLGRFFKFGTKGLENPQLDVVLFHVFSREIVG